MTAQSAREVTERRGDRVGRLAHVAKYIDMIQSPKTKWDRFRGLRGLYGGINTDEWEAYIVDWMSIFTPIEKDVWSDMRFAGVLMWPQFPVGRYFLDFADPKLRIAIECDGKAWHDSDKDMERDTELLALGWTIFRVPGSACKRTITPDWAAEEPEDTTRWLLETSEGLVSSIAIHYYDRTCGNVTPDDAVWALKHHASRATPFVE